MIPLEKYLTGFPLPYTSFDIQSALGLYRPRDPFAHKGSFGHALLLAGSYGKMGAAVLAAKACLAAGAGLLTAHLPSCGYDIMQNSVPEAMAGSGEGEFFLTGFPSDLGKFRVAGVGPGIGTEPKTSSMLGHFISAFKGPVVLDADALNIISHRPEILKTLAPDTILTPHPKEFDRLFGDHASDQLRFEKAAEMAVRYKIIILLKGHFSGIFLGDGSISFNTNGNAGMAKGGSGDALTGIITGLLAQSYTASDAAMLGAYLHGSAGDLAAKLYSEESMLPSDLIACIGKTYLEWKNK